MDRFLLDYKAAFLGQDVEIGLKGNSAWNWTGKLDRADESGVWLAEAGETRTTFIPWDAIESTTTPPLPED